jgi:hypothetical protein
MKHFPTRSQFIRETIGLIVLALLLAIAGVFSIFYFTNP